MSTLQSCPYVPLPISQPTSSTNQIPPLPCPFPHPQVNFWKAFAPFEPGLWFALLIALVVTVFLLWLFEGAKNDQFSRGGWGRRHRTATRGLSRSVYVTSSLMMSQLTHKPETLEGYLLTLGGAAAGGGWGNQSRIAIFCCCAFYCRGRGVSLRTRRLFRCRLGCCCYNRFFLAPLE